VERDEIETGAVEEVRRVFAEHASDLELGELVGRGGMGYVFRARQARLSREVAVKVLDPELSRNPLFAERFAREAQTLARLAHAHIVAVHDYGRAGELFYLVLEYVDGVNLRQIMKAGTLSPAQALAIVPQICAALAFAHERGVVHRDIKPENILLERGGTVKIADFGLAKLLGVDVPAGSLTSTGQVLGTLRYMAPEQMDRPLEVDHRADIYSLGVVFYEMLTGEIPMGRFAPPSQKVKVDVRLDEVVLHTLEREPERRYQHAVEVKTDVEAIGAGKSPRGAGAREIRRVSWLAVASAVVAFGLPAAGTICLVSGLLVPLHFSPDLSTARPFVLLAFFHLVVMGVGCALGWAALERIRARWPTLFGIGAALSAHWFLPLYALNTLVGMVLFALVNLTVGSVPPVLGVLFGLACLAFDVWFIARRRRRLLGQLEIERRGS
jgi:tRNA A-37 threonylcarbamoyl transferase component Bud32